MQAHKEDLSQEVHQIDKESLSQETQDQELRQIDKEGLSQETQEVCLSLIMMNMLIYSGLNVYMVWHGDDNTFNNTISHIIELFSDSTLCCVALLISCCISMLSSASTLIPEYEDLGFYWIHLLIMFNPCMS